MVVKLTNVITILLTFHTLRTFSLSPGPRRASASLILQATGMTTPTPTLMPTR